MLKPFFMRYALYNRWANTRLYDACAQLDPAEYHRERPAFFGSIHGTLNHVLVGDRIWLSRIRGPKILTDPLDTILYEEFAELRAAREAEDEGLVAWIEGLGDADLAGEFSYPNMAGEPQRSKLATVLQHVFNHQTHHRGQVHDQLSQTSVAPPPLDMIYFVREVPEAA